MVTCASLGRDPSATSPSSGLTMIWFASIDLDRAEQLLQGDEPSHLVQEGERRQRPAEVGARDAVRMQAFGAADDQREPAPARVLRCREIARELPRREHHAL